MEALKNHITARTLDVEQIGSVYEAVMGFRLAIATGRSVAIKPTRRLGDPATTRPWFAGA